MVSVQLTYNTHSHITFMYKGAATVELVAVSQIKSFIQGKWDLGTRELGYMSTATFIGEVFGGIIWAQLSDACGMRYLMYANDIKFYK